MRKIFLVIPVVALVGGSSLAILASPQPQSGAVDGWVIGDPVSCPQIGASSAAQCQELVDRAVAGIPSTTGATIVAHSIHAVGARIVNGQQVRQAFPSTSVLGLLVVQFSDGKRHAVAFGCAGAAGASSARDPLCPAGGAPFP